MTLMTLYVYSFDRLSRAVMLTCSTADTSFLVNCRDQERILILKVFYDKTDSSCRAVSGATQALYIVSVYDAKVGIDDGVTYLYG